MKYFSYLLLTVCFALSFFPGISIMSSEKIAASDEKKENLETATFGMGCFWCSEAVFQRIPGVHSVVSGYSGGHVKNPTYEQVSTGTTGHAEVVQIEFDPQQVSFSELLDVFWKLHDPTTLNRQGPDVGTQYRSVIFYHHEKQKAEAQEAKRRLDASGAFSSPIVTEIAPFQAFFPAENYHQEYYNLHGRYPYCNYVIRPKVEKIEKYLKAKAQAAPPQAAPVK